MQIVSEPGWCYVVTLSATGGPATAALPIIAPQLQADGAATPEVQPSHSPTAAAQQPSHAASAPHRQASGRTLGRSGGAAAAEEALGKLSLSDQPKGSPQAPSHNSSAQDLVSKGAEKPGAAQAVPSEPSLASTQQQQQQPSKSSLSINDPLRSPRRSFSQLDSSDGLHDDSISASKQQVPQQAPQAPTQVRLLQSARSGALPPCTACPTLHFYCLIRSEPFLGCELCAEDSGQYAQSYSNASKDWC